MITDLPCQLHAYSHTKTEFLVRKLIKNLRTHSPFTQQIIVVPNSGMQRYLQLQITEHLGIMAHIEVTYLGKYLWKVSTSNKDNKLPESRTLAFAIFHQLQSKTPETLSSILEHCKSELHRFELSTTLARLFIDYANTRTDWLINWQAGKNNTDEADEKWQMWLFNKIIDQFPSLIRSTNASFHPTSETLHVFGFHAMPESQRIQLWELALTNPVNLYVLTPSNEYWTTLTNTTFALKEQIAESKSDLHYDIGNPLLGHWGKAGKYFATRLIEDDLISYDEDEFIDNTNNEESTLLDKLQESIIYITDLIEEKPTKENDNSISIQACASSRREVEVLYDWICQQLDNDPTLNLSDFIVMTENIINYDTHIQAVFSASRLSSFSVANQTEATSQPEVSAFLSLLNVIQSRYKIQAFFDFISQVSIMKAFNIEANDLSIIHHWLIEANVNWGVTPEQKGEHVSDNILIQQGSLQKFIDELNLASLFGDTESTAVNPNYLHIQYSALKKLNELLSIFQKFTKTGYTSLTLIEWYERFISLLKACHLDFSEPLLSSLSEWIEPVSENTKNYELALIYADISVFLSAKELHGPFMSGGITFCTVQPMRAIPSKIICMLGMNQSFPIPDVLPNHDLRNQHRRPYDTLKHEENKYLFLETILCTREKLYISYIGIDENNAKPLPPSPLIAELVHFFKKSKIIIPTHVHPLQKFSNVNCWKNFNTSRHQYNIFSENQAAKNVSAKTKSNENNSDDYKFTLHQLVNFLCEPLNVFLEHQRIRSCQPFRNLSDSEMVLPDGLDKYHLKKSEVLYPEESEQRLKQANRLPASVVRSDIVESISETLTSFIATHNDIKASLPPESNAKPQLLIVELEGKEVSIQYDLTPIYGDRLYFWDVSSLKLKHLLYAWFSLACAQQSHTLDATMLYSKKKQVESLQLTLSDETNDLLKDILQVIVCLKETPLPFSFSLKDTKKRSVLAQNVDSFKQTLIPSDHRNINQSVTEELLSKLEIALNKILSHFGDVK